MTRRTGALSYARQGIGVLLIALVLIPFYRLLEGRETGLAGRATIGLMEVYVPLLWTGFAATLIAGLLVGYLFATDTLDRRLAPLGRWLTAPRAVVFGGVAAVASATLTAAFSLFVLDGKANLIDAMSQLVHARYLAAGELAGPVSPFAPFWHIQNTILTPRGWVSHYPPGHVALLALGFRLGTVWLIGPLLQGMTVLFTCLAADRLLPENRLAARLGTVFVALSPFMIGLAGAYMNHVTAAAFGALALYAAVRARDGSAWWSVLAGAGAGMVFATRPLTGIVTAIVAAGVWLLSRAGMRDISWRGVALRFAGALGGAAPLVAAQALYNHHFFGSPLRFGYDVALGPAMRPGFHRDPWGNVYGLIEALGYTSADLVALSLNLLETPVPVVALVGVYLLCAPRLTQGERIVAAWALLPVVANFFYWHHGLFMGPRMLNEAGPAWALLAAITAVGLVRLTPAEHRMIPRRYSPRAALAALFLVAWAIGLTYLAPERLLSYGREWQASTRIEPPRTPQPSLVFVHGAWAGRVAMRLAGNGMRLDSLETALRRNSTCALHQFAGAYGESSKREGAGAAIDFIPGSGHPPGYAPMEITPGNLILVRRGEVMAPACEREIHADRNGVVDIAPMLWQRDLPGLPPTGAMIVRDLGPEANAALIAQFPERTPYVFHTPTADADPVLVPYDEGMAAIWGTEPATDPAPVASDSSPSDGGSASEDSGAAGRSRRDGA